MLARLYETVTGFSCNGLSDIMSFFVFFGFTSVALIGVLLLLIMLFLMSLSSFLKDAKK